MDYLDFVSVNFVVLPWLLICLGIFTFILSGIGFIFSSSESRPLVQTYAALTAFACIVQIVSIFVAMMVWSKVIAGKVQFPQGNVAFK